jgi:uncharacterized protein YecE (DUF72 family)
MAAEWDEVRRTQPGVGDADVTVLIGTSGWQYADWRDPYYRGTPQRRWFEHLLGDFRTVELNVTFYRLPKAETFAGWHERSPADAVIGVKASRYITHVKRLRDPGPSVQLLMQRSEPLREKLGPVLVQLPPDLTVDADALDGVLRAFPRRVRVAVEPRHASWWSDEVRRVLERRGAALVWADRRGPITPLWRTAPWGYVRFHEGRARRWPFYGGQALRTWADRLAAYGTDDVYAYFNNDPGCAAVDNAMTLARRLDRLDVARTRVPAGRPEIG